MNRREFVQTSALFLAGSVCAGVPAHSRERLPRFRAQKVFFEFWNAENVWENSPHAPLSVQRKLECVRRSDCHALILMPDGRNSGGRSPARWMDKIVPAATLFDLNVFIPACLTRDFFDKICTIRPLSDEKGFLQSTEGKPAENGGFLLLNRTDEAYGLVLYDSSRCLWSGFSSSGLGFTQDAGLCENDSRLFSARWLDRAFLAR